MMNTIRVVVGLSCSMIIGASSICGGCCIDESSSCCVDWSWIVVAMSEEVVSRNVIDNDDDDDAGSFKTLCLSFILPFIIDDALVDAERGDVGTNAAPLLLLLLRKALAWHRCSSAMMDTRNASTRCVPLLPIMLVNFVILNSCLSLVLLLSREYLLL